MFDKAMGEERQIGTRRKMREIENSLAEI